MRTCTHSKHWRDGGQNTTVFMGWNSLHQRAEICDEGLVPERIAVRIKIRTDDTEIRSSRKGKGK